MDSENERVEDRSSSEGYKVDILAVFLLLVDATTDHHCASEKSWSVVLQTHPASSRFHPFVSFHVEDQQLAVEPFSFFTSL